MWLTAHNVGENLPGDVRRTADRVSALADAGRIESRKEEGRTRMFRHLVRVRPAGVA